MLPLKESAADTVELVSISPDGPLVDNKGDTPGETLAMSSDMMRSTEGVGVTSPPVIIAVWRRGYQNIIDDPTHTTTHAI